MRFSVSSYNKHQKCPRLYLLEKVEVWKDITLKPWLKYGSNFGELMAFVDSLGLEDGISNIPTLFPDEFQAVEVEYLARKWALQYKDALEPVYKDIDGQHGNEFEIEIDLSHEVDDKFELIYTGFIDKVWNRDGEPAITERKTTGDPINYTSVYWNRLLFDPQIVGYSFGLGAILGTPVNHGTYEVFRKPKQAVDSKLFKRGTDVGVYRERLLNGLCEPVARSAEMVARKPYFITEEMREAWLAEFVSVATEIHRKKELMKDSAMPELLWTRNKDACDEFMPCVFKPFCGLTSSLENINLITKEN